MSESSRLKRIEDWKRTAKLRGVETTFVLPETGERFTFEGEALVAYDAGVTSGVKPGTRWMS